MTDTNQIRWTKALNRLCFMVVVMFALVVTIHTASGALETYFEEDATIFDSTSVGTISGRCGEWVDWDGDGLLDLIGFRNDTGATPDILWQIMINNGTNNTQPDFYVLYNFTVTTRGNRNNGGECVATGDLTGDGLLDILTYEEVVPDSKTTEGNDKDTNVHNKTGYKGFWYNNGTALSPQFVLNYTAITGPTGDSVLHEATALPPYDANYHMIPGGIIAPASVITSVCMICPDNICSSAGACYGENDPATQPELYFQFYDYDFDGDLDLITNLIVSGNWNAWENIGTPTNPSWVPSDDITPNHDSDFENLRIFDYNADGHLDMIGTREGPVAGNLETSFQNGLWNDISQFNYITAWVENTSLPWGDLTEEPVPFAKSAQITYIGDADGDGDLDMMFAITPASGNDYVFYRSKGWGIAGEYIPEAEGCSWPCVVAEDFSIPDGDSIADYPGWSAPDCIVVQDAQLVINGSCSTDRVCRDLSTKLTKDATVRFNVTIPSLSAGKYSTYYVGFNELSILNGWDGETQFYRYAGSYLPKYNLTTYDTDKNSYVSWMDIENENYSLEHEGFDGGLDFYASSSDITGLGRVCWNVINSSSVMYIDNLVIHAGTSLITDTTGTLIVNSSTSCFGPFCYETDGIVGDMRPTTYVQQPTQIGGLYVNWELCIEAGYRPNLLCPIKLMWDDGMTAIKDWFIDNIVLIAILLIILTTGAVLFVRGRRSEA